MRNFLLLAVIAFGLATTAPTLPAAAQSCEDGQDQCTVQDTCQADGSCRGTPVPNGTPCNDQNDCTANDQCQGGECVGTRATDGTPCQSFFGACATNPTCFFGFCVPADFVECPDLDGNACTFDVCNPVNGQCTVINIECNEDCSTAQCDPASGECINEQPRPGNPDCDDFNVCTTNDRCQNGECRGTGGGGGTPTHTHTPAQTTPTPTVTTAPNTPTATRTLPPLPTLGPCFGDCDDDGMLTVDEIVLGIQIGLFLADKDACDAFDIDGDGEVTIDELVKGIRAGVRGCRRLLPTATAAPATATPTVTATATTGGIPPTATLTSTATVAANTPTITPTVAGATPTATTGGMASIARRASGVIVSTSSIFLVVPDVLSVLLNQTAGLGGAAGIGALPFECPAGGGGTIGCTQDIIIRPPFFGPPTYRITLDDCAIAGGSGAVATLDGSLSATGREGEACFVDPPQSAAVTIPSLTAMTGTAERSTTATFTNVTAQLALSGQDDQCTYNALNLTLNGTMSLATMADGSPVSMTTAMFTGTTLDIDVSEYAEDCVAVLYTMVVGGTAALTTDGRAFTATYVGYRLAADATGGDNLVAVSGAIDSACFGPRVTFATPTALNLIEGEPCPAAGRVTVTANNATDAIIYQSVEIDRGNNGSVDETFQSCLDPRLYECPA
jgi:hypothetical protein